MKWDDKPICQRCKTNINIVEFKDCFRCAFCGEKAKIKEQTTLI